MTYPVWLDYIAWVFGIAGALCGMSMLTESAGRKRGILKLCACLLLAVGFGCASTEGIFFNLRAPILTATGQLFYVVHHSGKNSSTNFRLHIPTGEIDDLHLSANRRSIVNGDIAKVTYQANSFVVLRIEILEGQYAGYETTDTNGLTGAIFGLLAAVALGLYGVLDWFNDGTATPSEPNDRDMPDGDVDTKSMLNLDSPD